MDREKYEIIEVKSKSKLLPIVGGGLVILLISFALLRGFLGEIETPDDTGQDEFVAIETLDSEGPDLSLEELFGDTTEGGAFSQTSHDLPPPIVIEAATETTAHISQAPPSAVTPEAVITYSAESPPITTSSPTKTTSAGTVAPRPQERVGTIPPATQTVAGTIPVSLQKSVGQIPNTSVTSVGSIPPTKATSAGTIAPATQNIVGTIPPATQTVAGTIPVSSQNPVGQIPNTTVTSAGSIPSTKATSAGTIAPATQIIAGTIPPETAIIAGTSNPVKATPASELPGGDASPSRPAAETLPAPPAPRNTLAFQTFPKPQVAVKRSQPVSHTASPISASVVDQFLSSHQVGRRESGALTTKEARAYCKWLTEQDRAAGILASNEHYRLPFLSENASNDIWQWDAKAERRNEVRRVILYKCLQK